MFQYIFLLGMTPSVHASTNETFREKKENQIVVQVSLIVGSFLLGYIPRTGLLLTFSFRLNVTKT